jgi:hypothetical protein
MGLLLASTIVLLGAPAPLAAAGVFSRSSTVTPAQAGALGQQAFLYGFPLLEFLRVRQTATSVRCPDARGDAPLNSFSTATHFADPSSRTVVAPNVDTLYSIAHLDLARGPVVLKHSNMGRRYFVFQLLDPYTNVIGYIGTRTTGSRAGRFAIVWRGHPGRRVAGARIIRSDYQRVWVIGRTLAGDRADQRRAVALMRQYQLAPPGGVRHFSPSCRPGVPHSAATPTGLAFLDALGQALKANPPPARDAPLLRQLATVGVGPGLRPERAGLSAASLSALVARVSATATALPGLVRSTVVSAAAAHGGWATPRAEIGNYGTDYTYRAGVAEAGLGANTPAEAVYPTAYTDSAGQTLGGGHSYRLVFRRGLLPPARAFWSLTLYDNDGFLVPNAIHRYAIGDTHPPLLRRADGSVVIIIRRTRPTEAGVSWLPAPPGPFRLSLRLYWPRSQVLRGSWQPPPLERVG